MIEYIMWKFINPCSIILYRTLFMSNIFTLVIYKLATLHCQWLLPNQFVLCVWVLLCFVHACFLTCLICESCEQNLRMLFPAHQFIKFQKSCAIQLFYFRLLGRGGEKVGLHLNFTYEKDVLKYNQTSILGPW